MNKNKKSIQKKFIKNIEGLLSSFGIKAPHPYLSNQDGYELNTIAGSLMIHVDKDSDWCYTVFGRFSDKDKFNECEFLTNSVNKYSGKWNFHYFDPIRLYSDLERSLRAITLNKA